MNKLLLYSAFLTALASVAGSLFFSEILHFAPCILCWYQRIAMYPLVILFAVGIVRKDQEIYLYTLPLSLIGLGIALFQNLLTWKIIPETISPCNASGTSCTTLYINWLGFITIPFLSLLSFIVITGSMLLYWKRMIGKI